MTTSKAWLTVPETAERTGFSVHTIRDAAASGELVGHRRPGSPIRGHWRFRPEDIDRWLGGPPAADLATAGAASAPPTRARRRRAS